MQRRFYSNFRRFFLILASIIHAFPVSVFAMYYENSNSANSLYSKTLDVADLDENGKNVILATASLLLRTHADEHEINSFLSSVSDKSLFSQFSKLSDDNRDLQQKIIELMEEKQNIEQKYSILESNFHQLQEQKTNDHKDSLNLLRNSDSELLALSIKNSSLTRDLHLKTAQFDELRIQYEQLQKENDGIKAKYQKSKVLLKDQKRQFDALKGNLHGAYSTYGDLEDYVNNSMNTSMSQSKILDQSIDVSEVIALKDRNRELTKRNAEMQAQIKKIDEDSQLIFNGLQQKNYVLDQAVKDYQEKISFLEHGNKNLTSQNQALTLRIEQLQDELDNKPTNALSLEDDMHWSDNADLMYEKMEYEENISNLTEKNNNLEVENVAKQRIIDDLNSAKIEIEKKNFELSQQLSALEKEKKILLNEKNQNQTDLLESKEKIAFLDKITTSFQDEKSILLQKIEDLNNEKNKLVSEQENFVLILNERDELQKKLEIQNSDYVLIDKKNQDLQMSNEEIQRQNFSLKSRLSDADIMIQQLKDDNFLISQQVLAARNTIDELTKQNQILTVLNTNTDESVMKKIKDDQSFLEHKIEALEREKNASYDELIHLGQNVKELNEQVMNLNLDKKQLEQNIIDLNNDKNNIADQFIKEKKIIENEVERLKENNVQILNAKNQLEQENLQLQYDFQKKLQEAEKKNLDVNNDIDDLKLENDQLKMINDTFKLTIADLESQNQGLEQKVIDINRVKLQLENDNQKLLNEYNVVSQKLNNAIVEIDNIKLVIDDLKKKLDQSEKAYIDAKNTVTVLQKDLQNAQQASKQFENEKVDALEKLRQAEQNLNDAHQKLLQAENDKKIAEQDVLRLNSDIKLLEDQRKHLTSTNQSLQDAIKGSSSLMASQNSQLIIDLQREKERSSQLELDIVNLSQAILKKDDVHKKNIDNKTNDLVSLRDILQQKNLDLAQKDADLQEAQQYTMQKEDELKETQKTLQSTKSLLVAANQKVTDVEILLYNANQEINQKNQEIELLNNALLEARNNLQKAQQDLVSKDGDIDKKDLIINQQIMILNQNNIDLRKKDQIIERQGNDLIDKDVVIDAQTDEINQKNNIILAKDQLIQQQQFDLQNIKQDLDQVKADLQKAQNKVRHLMDELNKKNLELSSKDGQILKQNFEINRLKSDNLDLRNQNAKLKNTNKMLLSQLSNAASIINDLMNKIKKYSEKMQQIISRKTVVLRKDDRVNDDIQSLITQLKKDVTDLECKVSLINDDIYNLVRDIKSAEDENFAANGKATDEEVIKLLNLIAEKSQKSVSPSKGIKNMQDIEIDIVAINKALQKDMIFITQSIYNLEKSPTFINGSTDILIILHSLKYQFQKLDDQLNNLNYIAEKIENKYDLDLNFAPNIKNPISENSHSFSIVGSKDFFNKNLGDLSFTCHAPYGHSNAGEYVGVPVKIRRISQREDE